MHIEEKGIPNKKQENTNNSLTRGQAALSIKKIDLQVNAYGLTNKSNFKINEEQEKILQIINSTK